ncbi:hypothetical protein LWM68_19320 [Niabella sp. W65]|nr:hypothetical protein [Niabella sp. W65]MCH7364717.1 hypothetical protein [Niabella sp. W65]
MTAISGSRTSFEGASRQGAIGFSLGGVGYITTGTGGSTYFDDLWEFYPDQEQTSTDNYKSSYLSLYASTSVIAGA